MILPDGGERYLSTSLFDDVRDTASPSCLVRYVSDFEPFDMGDDG